MKVEKNQREKLIADVLSATLLCVIHGATLENILFEDGDGINIFCAFNPTQVFLHLKKIVIDPLRSAGQYGS